MTATEPTVVDPRQKHLDGIIDSCLIEWFTYRRDQLGARPDRKTSTGSGAAYAQTPTHMDWWNGANDAHADELEVLAIVAALEAVPDEPRRWNLALQFQAKNLATRSNVWFSPRLPPTRAELDVLLMEARNKFAIELQERQIIERK